MFVESNAAETPLTDPTPSSRALRTIGQALEFLHLETFELVCKGNDFVIRTQPADLRKSLAEDIQAVDIAAVWRRLRDRYLSEKAHSHQRQAPLELHYSSSDIEQLDRAKTRSGTDGKKPDPFNLPEMLRLVGTYVDDKGARLLKLSKREQELTIQYQTERGESRTEVHNVSSFYDLSVHMYLKRHARKA
jgi:hypothetical protein